MRVSIIFIALFFIYFSIDAQRRGCTDPRAANYDPGAEINDGSCLYEKTTYEAREILDLSDSLHESSGLFFYKDCFWSQNDGGNPPVIYGFDSNQVKLQQKIFVRDALNKDWEELAQDSNFIYIGDFGNNRGSRKDLRVLRIGKKDITDSLSFVETESIHFSYPDQKDFSQRNQAHNFDCEAFFVLDDSIYLFSKNWLDQKTKLYRIPAMPGNHVADLLDSFDVNGLITAADYFEGQIVLLGYQNYKPFIWLMFDFQEKEFFSGNKRRIDLKKLLGCQAEGVCFTDQINIIFSSERTPLVSQKLFGVYCYSWIRPINLYTEDNIDDTNDLFTVYPNPAKDHLTIAFEEKLYENVEVTLISSASSVLYQKEFPLYEKSRLRLNLNELKCEDALIYMKIKYSRGEYIVKVLMEK